MSPVRRLERILLRNSTVNVIASLAAKWALTLMIWPRFVAPFRWELTRFAMPLAADPAFDGYKILHLTDLHAGKTRLSYLTEVSERSVAEKPDIVVVTGDLIDYARKSLKDVRELLACLMIAARDVPDGVLAILGNHDYHEYSWRHIGARSARRAIHTRLVEIVQTSGVRLLRNQSARIVRNSKEGGRAELVFVGLDEMWSERADAALAFAGVSPAEAVICLQHNPDGIDFLKDQPWQYMLCGHSHGGQAVFPLVGPIYLPMEHREYLRGFFHFPTLPGQPSVLRQRTMFVSRGLGYSTPIRLFCPPEATLFTVQVVG